MKNILSSLVILLIFPLSVRAESYLCIVEQSVGFHYIENEEEWKSVTLKAVNKYLVTRQENESSETENPVTWTLKLHGTPAQSGSGSDDLRLLPTQCRTDFDDDGFLRCRGARDLIMNRDTMRFTTIWNLGYVTRRGAYERALGPEGKYFPQMEIGECSIL